MKVLPNKWQVSLSNEKYFSSNMTCYESKGTPPFKREYKRQPKRGGFTRVPLVGSDAAHRLFNGQPIK